MGQKKKILSDSIWSVAGLVLMNVALQFAVYPFWERRAGEAALGNILYLISLMNIFAVVQLLLQHLLQILVVLFQKNL